jgi:dnd system-associated protein 4
VTTPSSDIRIRRPPQHEVLLTEMRDEGGFATFRDALLFAAAVGACYKRKAPFSGAAGDPIRYETLTAPTFSEALVNMIAANEVNRDPEIMDSTRLDERVRIFEAYTNGGLEYIQEQVNIRHQPVAMVAIALVTEALARTGGAEPASVDELLSGVSW